MKKIFNFIIFLVLTISSISCNGQERKLRDIKTPIWTDNDLKKFEGGALITYDETINVPPMFYNGSMPLHFTSGKRFRGPEMMTTVYHDFDDFRNTFIYADVMMGALGIAGGARTTDRSGRLLAEARLSRMITSDTTGLKGLEIEEYHYNRNGKLIFKCKSLIEFPIGFKSKEYDLIGKKQTDYYFIWPVTDY
jgi:hypothetical protein